MVLSRGSDEASDGEDAKPCPKWATQPYLCQRLLAVQAPDELFAKKYKSVTWAEVVNYRRATG